MRTARSVFHIIFSLEILCWYFLYCSQSPALFISVFAGKQRKKKSNFHGKLCRDKWKTFVPWRKILGHQQNPLKIECWSKNATERIKYLGIILWNINGLLLSLSRFITSSKNSLVLVGKFKHLFDGVWKSRGKWFSSLHNIHLFTQY